MPRSVHGVLGAAVLCAAAVTACATPRVTDEMRAAFGDVAVVVSDEPTEIQMDHVTAGWAAGAGMGLVRGVGAVVAWPTQVLLSAPSAGCAGGGGIICVIALAGAVAVAAAAAAAWTPVSMVGGAVTAIPVEEAHAAQAVLLLIARDPGHRERVAQVVADAARRWRGRDLVGRDDADTIVEVHLVSIRHGQSWNWWTFDRPFGVGVEVRVSVTRRGDDDALWEDTRTAGALELDQSVVEPPLVAAVKGATGAGGLVSRKLTYREWAAHGGAPFRGQIESELDFLGRSFAAEIFPAGSLAPRPHIR